AERFRDVAVAEAEGYHLLFGCVSDDDEGAMGLHYVNLPLVADGELDPTRPEIVIYEPTPGGGLRLVGADFLVFAEAWDAKGVGTPQLMGQLLHLFGVRIASGCRRSTRCMSGRGRKTRRARS